MVWYTFLKVVHILGATVLLGTGTGIAFFMLMAHRSRKPDLIAQTVRIVVLADYLFTATSAILQPLTGIGLAILLGMPLQTFWIAASITLYFLVGCLWLPVVWIQLQLRDLALASARDGSPLPMLYHRLFRIWLVCGGFAFPGVIAIFWLMVAKPDW